MAGQPEYANNPVQSGNYASNGDQSMEVALATKMQLILDQPMADVDSGLTNRDFEGDFFRIGDTVAIVKPDVSSVNIKFGTINTRAAGGRGIDPTPYENKDARLAPTNVDFDKNLMSIDKYTKYAFYVSDLQKLEGKWSYESGNLDLHAQEIRKRHNLETVQMVINNAIVAGTDALLVTDQVETLGSSPASPIVVADGNALYKNVIVKIFAKLYDKGAITADGQITYGSNSQEGKSTAGQIFLPTDLYTELLTSNYLQDRSTVAADEKVASGKFKTIMGLDVAIEPSLNPDAERHVTITGAGDGVMAIVAGTRNLITKAGKVLPPEKLRSREYFADEFHGMEIYGKKIVEPKAGVCVFVKLGE